jgi:hypothetical protein
LFVIFAVVLPITGTYAIELAIWGFELKTVAIEWAQSLPLAVATVGLLMFWAVIWPNPRGFLAGFVTVWVIFFAVQWMGMDVPHDYGQEWPNPWMVILLLALPALPGLPGVLRRQTAREDSLSGFTAGLLLSLTILLLPLIQAGIENFTDPEESLPQREGETWELAAAGKLHDTGRFRESVEEYGNLWRMDVAGIPLANRNLLSTLAINRVSWRKQAQDPWTVWDSAEGWIMAGEEAQGDGDARPAWRLIWTTQPGAQNPPEFQGGELELSVTARALEEKVIELPATPGRRVHGEGWAFEVLRASNGYHNHVEVSLQQSWFASKGEPNVRVEINQHDRELRLPGDNSLLTPVRQTLALLYAGRTGTPARMIRLMETRKAEVRRLIHVSRVHLVTEPSSKTPSLPEITKPPAPRKDANALRRHHFPDIQRTFPLFEESARTPGADATEVEVATYLHRELAHREWLSRSSSFRYYRKFFREGDSGIEGLVERWLPLFIEIAVYSRGGLIGALLEGTPEARKDEVLRRIPECPALIEVAVARRWQAEAKPYILQYIQNADTIPGSLEPLCRQYRDPAFHEAMRHSFTPNLPTVRYWASMPDLVAELPARLARAKAMHGFRGREAVFLYAGDMEVLDDLLQQWSRGRTRPSNESRDAQKARTELLRQYLRTADGGSIPVEEGAAGNPGGTKAEDYVFDPARHLFFRKPASLNP